VLWIVPRIAAQAALFIQSIDLGALKARLDPILGVYATSSAEIIEKVRERALKYLQENGTTLLMPAFRTLGSVTAIVLHFVSRVLELVLIPVLTFYLLRDSHSLRRYALDLIPPSRRAQVVGLFSDIDKVLRRFIRGQIIVSAILGVLYAIGLLIMGTPLAGAHRRARRLREPDPVRGFAFGLGMGLLLSFLQYGSWARLLGIVIAFAIVQILEGS
jgi:predicted PurR-regulated permease PerM